MKVKNYIRQLYQMINESTDDICGWQDEGHSIYVFDNDKLRACLGVSILFFSRSLGGV